MSVSEETVAPPEKRTPRWRVDPDWPHPEDVEGARAAWGAIPVEVREIVAAWWTEWYMKCGHKRCGRIVLGKPTELSRKKKGE